MVFVDYEPEIENRECEYVLSLSDILLRRRNKILSHNNLKYIYSDNQWCISCTPYNNKNVIISLYINRTNNSSDIDMYMLKTCLNMIKDYIVENNIEISFTTNIAQYLNSHPRKIVNIIKEIFSSEELPNVYACKSMK